MQIVTDGSVFPGLHVWAPKFWISAKGRQTSTKRSRRVNICVPRVRASVACTWMPEGRTEFAAERAFYSLGLVIWLCSFFQCVNKSQSMEKPHFSPRTRGMGHPQV